MVAAAAGRRGAGQRTRARDVERRVGAQVAVIQLGAQGGVRQQLQHARRLLARVRVRVKIMGSIITRPH
jgi:hypothetical protein